MATDRKAACSVAVPHRRVDEAIVVEVEAVCAEVIGSTGPPVAKATDLSGNGSIHGTKTRCWIPDSTGTAKLAREVYAFVYIVVQAVVEITAAFYAF